MDTTTGQFANGGGPDVDAHAMWSDERLKETIRQLERSLASLRQLQVEKDRRR